MNRPVFKNERTMASAGSGKTYALTNRFIALILGGASPDEICALTFTRKAAAEFFDKTVMKLAEAAGSESEAESLSIQMKKISAELMKSDAQAFTEILKRFVKSAPSIHMETIDAFASRYIRFFATELGIGEEITIMDDFSRSRMEARAIAQTLARFSENKKAFGEFAEAFRLANMGSESKSVHKDLAEFISKAHVLFLSHPNHANWGNPKSYGREKLARWDDGRYAELLEVLKSGLSGLEDRDELKSKTAITAYFESARPKNIIEPKNKQTLALADYYRKNKTTSGLSIPKSRGDARYSFPPDAEAAMDAMLAMLIDGDIELSCASLKAIWLIMRAYEHTYAENVRKKGLMSFSDIPYAISSSDFAGELVEHRFDTKFSHWLFDEFQDTSRSQWRIFENLIEEAVLNSENEKTFYYVGDVKQSIYSWRGGDPRLFDEIKDHFDRSITDNEQIRTSWRSAPAVIDAVNRLFSDRQALALHFGESAAQRWFAIWQDHDVAKPNRQLPGCVSMQTYADKSDMPDCVYEYIKKARPLQKGLSCAVLTRTNKSAEEIVETIRKRSAEDGIDMRAAGELEVLISSDNMAVPALLAFASSAWHPSDTFSREYLRMTPLEEYVKEPAVFEEFLNRAAAFGFSHAFQGPVEFLAKAADETFTRTRLLQFLEMAEVFDSQNLRDADAFLDFARKYKIREGAASDTIQVMSIHKSKGLDFDMVILPELEKAASPGGLRMEVLENGDIVRTPSKAASMFDQSLAQMRKEILDKSAFESLCLYYVAMTRAKQAVHTVMLERASSKDATESRDFARFFQDVYSGDAPGIKILEGDSKWIDEKPISDEGPAPIGKGVVIMRSKDENLSKMDIQVDFEHGRPEITFGNCAHSILEKISENGCDLENASNAVRHLYADDMQIFADAKTAVRKLLEKPEIKNVFLHKNYWSEKSYIVSNECGRFDRVNFYPDEKRAELIDFKSVSSLNNTEHRLQLERYKEALLKLADVEDVSLKVISIADAKIVSF